MSTKPILFSTPMVQALLDGRKTMTRRVIKPQPDCPYVGFDNWCDSPKNAERLGKVRRMPLAPGDILWVRETWCNISDWTCVDPSVGLPDGFIYKADWHTRLEHPRWRPSIFMPREAARLFLARCEAEGKLSVLKTAAKGKKGWHVSDEMAYRFPGERTDRRTK